jgi:hypothetical protein
MQRNVSACVLEFDARQRQAPISNAMAESAVQ